MSLTFKWLVVLSLSTVLVVGQEKFDIDVDSAVIWSTRILRSKGNLFAGGPTLSARHTSLNALAYFDALAPYTENATGIVTQIARRPRDEWTQRNKNLAIIYAVTQVTRFLLPEELEENGSFRKWILEAGVDPEGSLEDEETPKGIGIKVGHGVVSAHVDDGVNIKGDKNGRKYKKVPYSDYTGYQPVNTAFVLNDPSRWQPQITPVAKVPGKFCVQQFGTPQFGRVKAFCGRNVTEFEVPPHGRVLKDLYPAFAVAPHASRALDDLYLGDSQYKKTVDDILDVSYGLTDEQKMLAEFFDDKFNSLPASIAHAAKTNELSVEDFVAMDLIVNFAVHDTLVAVWHEKARYDAVRPFSAIPHVYGSNLVKAWGGPGNGAVEDLPAKEWRSYLPTPDHPEYPSASAALCAAHAESVRRFLGTDKLNMTVKFAKGSSKIEPKITPATDIEYTFTTWTQFERDCGLSRVYGGVHFRDSIEVIEDMAHSIAGFNIQLVQQHLSEQPNKNLQLNSDLVF